MIWLKTAAILKFGADLFRGQAWSPWAIWCPSYLNLVFNYGGLFIFVFFFAAGFVFFLVPGSMLSCFSDFLLLCLHCFSAFPASLLFLLLCFSAFCFSCFFAFLLLCFPCFSAFVLLCLSTSTILLFLFFSHVFLLLYFLPVFTVSLFVIFFCFILFCLYPKWNPRKTLGETQRNLKEILIRNPTWSPKWTLKKP